MVDRALLRRLCEVLAELCPDETTSRRFATFAELDLRLIDFGGNSMNRWLSILQVADNAGRIDILLQVVQEDYGKNAWFQSVYQSYLQGVEQAKNTSSSNPEPIAHRSGRTAVKLVLDRDLREYSQSDQDELIEAIGRLLKVGKLELEVIAVAPGSVVLTLELPTNRVADLLQLFLTGQLGQYGVTHIFSAEPFGRDKTKGTDLIFVGGMGLEEGYLLRNDILIDQTSRRVYVKGKEISNLLPTAEYRALVFLAQRAGEDVTAEDMTNAVWPEENEEVSPQRLATLMERLRKIIQDQYTIHLQVSAPVYIPWNTGLTPVEHYGGNIDIQSYFHTFMRILYG